MSELARQLDESISSRGPRNESFDSERLVLLSGLGRVSDWGDSAVALEHDLTTWSEAHDPELFAFRENVPYERSRRILDVALSALGLSLAFPLLLVASVAILCEDGAPVLFRQQRVGRFGKLFVMYKLRTMYRSECGDGHAPSSRTDSRITKTGKWLRKLSIDELPQLFNVLRGDMSLVGPRPEMPFIVRNYQNWQHLRHLVPPGLTGLWQITHRKSLPLHDPAATLIDLQYIRRASLATDISILLKTVRAVILSKGAY